MKIAIVDVDYDALVGGQTIEVVTCLIEDVKAVHKDEYVKEVNSYELWDAEFEMDFKENDDGLYEDRVSDVWIAKEYLYGILEFIIGTFDPTILEEDEIYTWTQLIVKEYCQQQAFVPAR